jgi:HPt (histidine-containing phosphotransfer) domain-containing protein
MQRALFSHERTGGLAMNLKIDETVLFDTDHLETYTLGDHSIENEVLHMFLDQTALYMERLQCPRDAKDWYETAHSLKGSAKGVGAFKVGKRAEQLEKIKEPLKESVRMAILTLLQSDLDKTKIEIMRHLDKKSSIVFI